MFIIIVNLIQKFFKQDKQVKLMEIYFTLLFVIVIPL